MSAFVFYKSNLHHAEAWSKLAALGGLLNRCLSAIPLRYPTWYKLTLLDIFIKVYTKKEKAQ